MTLDLDAIEAQLARTTPAPWRVGAMESGRYAVDGGADKEVTGFIDPEDALFMIDAHRFVPLLVAEVRRLQLENEKLKMYLDKEVEARNQALRERLNKTPGD